MNVLPNAAPVRPATAPWPGEEPRILLNDVGWQSYLAIGDALRDRPALRLTYDRGSLEIMTTSPEHEQLKKRLGRLLEVLAEEFGLEIMTAGNMTFRREDLQRGLEPDDCFWIAQEAKMRTRAEWDPAADPPPDLALEIEISRSAVKRVPIYAAFGVPEVWRFDGETLQVHLLQPDGTYQTAQTSPTFPGIPLADLVPFTRPSEERGYLGMVRAFRERLRQLRPRGGAPDKLQE